MFEAIRAGLNSAEGRFGVGGRGKGDVPEIILFFF